MPIQTRKGTSAILIGGGLAGSRDQNYRQVARAPREATGGRHDEDDVNHKCPKIKCCLVCGHLEQIVLTPGVGVLSSCPGGLSLVSALPIARKLSHKVTPHQGRVPSWSGEHSSL